MKRIERKHLKENELAHSIEAARDYLEPRRGLLAKIASVCRYRIVIRYLHE